LITDSAVDDPTLVGVTRCTVLPLLNDLLREPPCAPLTLALALWLPAPLLLPEPLPVPVPTPALAPDPALEPEPPPRMSLLLNVANISPKYGRQ